MSDPDMLGVPKLPLALLEGQAKSSEEQWTPPRWWQRQELSQVRYIELPVMGAVAEVLPVLSGCFVCSVVIQLCSVDILDILFLNKVFY